MSTRTSRARSLGAALAATATTLVPGRLAAGALPDLAVHPTPDDVVLVGLTGTGTLAAARLALASLLLLAHALLPTRRRLATAARRVAPAVLRRMVTVSVVAGLGLGGGVAAADESDLGWVVTSPTAVVAEPAVVEPVVAERVVAEPVVAPPHPTVSPPAAGVVVSPGDTLWGLTADRLGPDAGRIAAAWPEVHEANRAVIGPDPDLIHPGQVLDLSVLDDRP